MFWLQEGKNHFCNFCAEDLAPFTICFGGFIEIFNQLNTVCFDCIVFTAEFVDTGVCDQSKLPTSSDDESQ